MSEVSKEQVIDAEAIRATDKQTQWTTLSFTVIAVSFIVLYVVIPLLYTLFSKKPDASQKITEGVMLFNLMLSQLPVIAVLLVLAFAVQKDLSIRDKFDFKNWNWIYLVLPLGLEFLMLPAIWLVTQFFVLVSERLFETQLEAGHVESFLMDCSSSSFVYMAIGAVIVAPVIEELVFRKIIYSYVKNYSSTIAAVLITSILFAVIHCSIIKIPALFVLALFMQALYIRYRSIYPAIIFHMIHNGATFLILAFFRSEYGQLLIDQSQ